MTNRPVEKSRFMLIAGIAMLATLLPLLLTRQSPAAREAHRIRDRYLAAEVPVLRPGSGVREVERFLWDLKSIDISKAPKDVQLAMTKLTVAVEGNLHTRQFGGDVDAANDSVANAKKDLIRALEKWRGQPF